jgi:hypothetical protein
MEWKDSPSVTGEVLAWSCATRLRLAAAASALALHELFGEFLDFLIMLVDFPVEQPLKTE